VSGAYPVLHVGSFGSFGSFGSAESVGSVGSARAPLGPWVRAFRGTPASVPSARRFVGELLVGCPARDVLMTCVSELCANAVTHTLSGSGGVFIVSVACPSDGVARVEVTDSGGSSVPVARGLDLAAEGGRGLALVAALTSRWGWVDACPGRTVWAEACWPVGVPSPGRCRRCSPVPSAPPVSAAPAPPAPPAFPAPPAPGDWTPSPAA
jgi:hypothetical protein